MKIVLINPPGNLEKTLGKLKGVSTATPPMGLAYIAANLLKNNLEASIIDAYAKNFNIEKTFEAVKEYSPGLVGINVLTPAAPIAHRLAALIKKYNNKIIVVFGGSHSALMPNETLSDKNVDIVVRAEGEFTLLEIARSLNSADFSRIKNISYRRGGEVIHNPDGEYITNLDTLPFPAWKLLDLKLYNPPPHWDIKNPSLPIMASRGCPYRCTYCSLKTMGRGYRMRSPENIADEIEWLVNDFKIKQVMFMDAAFPLNRKWGFAVCEEIIKRGLNNKVVWLCETRVNHVDLELLKKMKQAGCRRVAFGVESGNQELLNNIKKGFKLNQVREGFELAKKAKLETIAYFMLGLPGETPEKSAETIKFAKELDADYVKFNLTVPYPGTEMYDQAVKEGTLKSLDWELFTSFSSMTEFDPVYVPSGLTKDILMNTQKKAIREYYFRPKKIIGYVLKIRSLKDITNNFKALISLVKGVMNKK